VDADALITAIRDVIKGDAGSVRTVPAGFGEDVAADTPDAAKWLRGTSFDVRFRPPRRTPGVGPVNGSRALLVVEVDVRLTYRVEKHAALVESRRYEVRAQAGEDALTITQALTWPGNVPGFVGAQLRQRSGGAVTRADWRAGIYEVELYLEGLVNETQAVA
jgi:hypothetical protein